MLLWLRSGSSMLLDIVKALSFFLSILSLGLLVFSAFFVPGLRLEDRLVLALEKIALAGCVCFLSGLLFLRPWRKDQPSNRHLLDTLPVKMYLWTILGVAILFVLSWYFENYAPGLANNQP